MKRTLYRCIGQVLFNSCSKYNYIWYFVGYLADPDLLSEIEFGAKNLKSSRNQVQNVAKVFANNAKSKI